jgi:hypothetical protein
VAATVGVLLGGISAFVATLAGVRAGVAVRVAVAVAVSEALPVGLAFPCPVTVPMIKSRTMKAPTAMPATLRGLFTSGPLLGLYLPPLNVHQGDVLLGMGDYAVTHLLLQIVAGR